MAEITTVAPAEPHAALHTAVVAPAAIHVPEAKRFLYFYRQDRANVSHGHVLVSLVKLVVEPGVNRVDARGNPAEAISERQRRGWTLLPEDVAGEGSSYLALRTNNAGAQVWLDQHAIVHHGSAIIGDGSKAQAAWLAGLVNAGLVPKPHTYIVESMLDDLRASAAKLEDRAKSSEVLELRQLRENIEACGRFLAPPKPAKKATK